MRRQIVSTMYKNDVNKQINTSAYAFYFFFSKCVVPITSS